MSGKVASAASYLAVFLVLLALTALTVVLAFRDLGRWAQPVALAIAGTKALLVAAWFMHLRGAPPLTRIFAAAGVVWLLLLIGLSYADFHARSRVANSDRGRHKGSTASWGGPHAGSELAPGAVRHRPRGQ